MYVCIVLGDMNHTFLRMNGCEGFWGRTIRCFVKQQQAAAAAYTYTVALHNLLDGTHRYPIRNYSVGVNGNSYATF